MKIRLLFVLCMLIPVQSWALWKSDPQRVIMMTEDSNWNLAYSFVRISDGVVISGGSNFSNLVYEYVPNTMSAQPRKAVGTIPSFSWTVPFRVRAYATKVGTTSTTVEFGWWMSYDENDTPDDPAKNQNKEQVKGPDGFSDGAGGNNADPTQAPPSSPPPQNPDGSPKHKTDLTLSNSGPTSQEYQANTYSSGSGELLSSQSLTLGPGETRRVSVVTDEESYTQISRLESEPDGGLSYNPIYQGHSSPISSGGGRPASGTSQQSFGPTTNPASAAQSRPGTTEGNADARNTELRGDIQNVTKAIREAADRLANIGLDHQEATEGVGKEVKEGAEGIIAKLGHLGELLEGLDTGGGTGGEGEPVELDTGPLEDKLDELLAGQGSSTYAGNQGQQDAITSIGQGIDLIKSDIVAIYNRVSPFSGTASLSWSFDFYGTTHVVDLEGFSPYIDTVRAGILVWVAYTGLWSAVGILRGAFVDEGK